MGWLDMERIADLFDSIAPGYARWSEILSVGGINAWHHAAVRALEIEAGQAILDVGCGPGWVTRQIAARVGPGGHVVGLDPSPSMLRLAAREPSAHVQWVRGRGEHLPFADRTFDGVTAQFSLRNMGSWRDGIKEMVRVTRPGGKVVILDLVQPVSTRGMMAARALGVGTWALAESGWPGYRWLARSVKRAPTVEEVETLLAAQGVSLVIQHRWLGDLVLLVAAERLGRASGGGRVASARESQVSDGMMLARGEELRPHGPME